MRNFEKMVESIYWQHNVGIGKHEKIMLQKEQAFHQFHAAADDFDRKMEKFALQTEQWLIAQGKKSDLNGFFL